MNDEYFTSYDVSVHELMLKDVPRMESYYAALEKNKDLLKDKIVLDGTFCDSSRIYKISWSWYWCSFNVRRKTWSKESTFRKENI